MNYWLMKSEPEAFSIDDLKAKPESTEHWDGIRNYQARNFMRDDMKVGDKVLFYHSNCEEPGVVGIAEVASEAYPDHTAFDPAGKYYDPKSKEDSPSWVMVDVKFIEKFPKTVSLREIKTVSGLSDMRLVQKGNRLSIMPVEKSEFDTIVKMAGA
jgi:predicted RNA-binding protein with PUA-like domain